MGNKAGVAAAGHC